MKPRTQGRPSRRPFFVWRLPFSAAQVGLRPLPSVLQLSLRARRLLADSPLAGWAARIALVALACFVGGRIGLALQPDSPDSSPLWAASGVALAVLLRWGPSMAPGVGLGAFAVALSAGFPGLVAALIALGNTAGPALAAHLLRKSGLRLSLERRRDVALLVGIGAGLGPLVTSINAVAWLIGAGFATPRAWPAWWLGEAIGVLLLTVPLLTAHGGVFEWRRPAQGAARAAALRSGGHRCVAVPARPAALRSVDSLAVRAASAALRARCPRRRVRGVGRLAGGCGDRRACHGTRARAVRRGALLGRAGVARRIRLQPGGDRAGRVRAGRRAGGE